MWEMSQSNEVFTRPLTHMHNLYLSKISQEVYLINLPPPQKKTIIDNSMLFFVNL